MNKKIMILGASILQLPAIEKAKEMGLGIVVVDMDLEAVGFKVQNIEKEIISTIDIEGILKVAKKHEIDGIMTLATDMPMRSVAAVVEEMGLIGIDFETALKATDKLEMRKALQLFGVPIPKFYKVSNKKEYEIAIKKFSVPFIVKPIDSSGSRGIYLIEELMNQEKIDNAYQYSRKYSMMGDIIVEEYMYGPEVSVESLVIDGECHVIQITDKLTTGSPHFVEMGHSQPTKYSADIIAHIVKITKKANEAIGIKNGPSHTEIIITQEGPKIVELGARLGGDNITTHLVPLSTGINMVECCIRIALGEKPIIERKWNKGAAIRYFNQCAGIIKSINGIKKAETLPGVCQISLVHNVGEKVTEIDSSGSRMGFVISQSDSADKAISICENALKFINVEIESL